MIGEKIVEKINSKFVVTYYDLEHNLIDDMPDSVLELDTFNDAYNCADEVNEPSDDCVLGKATVELVLVVTYYGGETETISRLICTTDRFGETKFEKDLTNLK